MLRSMVLGAASAFAITSCACAADVWQGGGGLKDSYFAVANWSGFYFGANTGYAWNRTGNLTVNMANLVGTATLVGEGALGGLQAGYNWQRDRFVFGVEADIQGVDSTGSASASLPASGASPSLSSTAQVKSSLDWFGTLRVRAGAAVLSRGLIYATGGLAYGQTDQTLSLSGYNAAFTPPQNTAGAARQGVEIGYTVGGGFEYSFNSAWSMKVEYQYIDLGSVNLSQSFAIGGQAFSSLLSADRTYQVVRGGVNYHLTSPYEPLK